MFDDIKSPQQKWKESLDKKSKKLNKKDLRSLLAERIISDERIGKGSDKTWKIVGKNFEDRVITLVNPKEDDCLKDLATLNGWTVE